MLLTQSDITFARQKAFNRMFPSGLTNYLKKPRNFAPIADYADLDRAINARAGIHKLTPSTKRYMWNNTLYIIRSRAKRGEDWKALSTWCDGPSSTEHKTIVARLVRKLSKKHKRTDAGKWAILLGGK